MLAMLADQIYSPLVAHMVRVHDVVPCSVDSHIGEYLPFAHEIGGHHPAHVGQFERIDKVIERFTIWLSETSLPLPLRRMGHSLEEVIPIIASLWTGRRRQVTAVNVPNRGYLLSVALAIPQLLFPILIMLIFLGAGIYFGVQLGGLKGGILIIASAAVGWMVFAGCLELIDSMRRKRQASRK